MQAVPCIEVNGLPIPRSAFDGVATIDRRCYKNKTTNKIEQRLRLVVSRSHYQAIELSPDDAIAFFKQGIEFAEALKEGRFIH